MLGYVGPAVGLEARPVSVLVLQALTGSFPIAAVRAAYLAESLPRRPAQGVTRPPVATPAQELLPSGQHLLAPAGAWSMHLLPCAHQQ